MCIVHTYILSLSYALVAIQKNDKGVATQIVSVFYVPIGIITSNLYYTSPYIYYVIIRYRIRIMYLSLYVVNRKNIISF